MKSILLILAVAVVVCSKATEPGVAATPSPVPEIQYGRKVAGKPGFVTSPYAPKDGYVDVRGYPKDTEVRDPYSGKVFLVP